MTFPKDTAHRGSPRPNAPKAKKGALESEAANATFTIERADGRMGIYLWGIPAFRVQTSGVTEESIATGMPLPFPPHNP